MRGYFIPEEYSNEATYDLDCLILAVGFEERSYHSLKLFDLKTIKKIVLVHYDSKIEENRKSLTAAMEILGSSSFEGVLETLVINYHKPREFEKELNEKMQKLSVFSDKVYIDVSGFPSFAICQVLRIIRTYSLSLEQKIVYTSAKKYYPLKSKYDKLMKHETDADFSSLLTGMSLEMSDNLFLESFSGYKSNASSSCLVIFCGYEIHRSAGVIDNMNPSKLIMLYGKPGDQNIEWRLDLSKKVHERIEAARNTAAEVVSTLNMREALDMLEVYYENLYDDHDLSIAPVCSKMQSVASYVFWERYKEVQLVFPVPIGHSVEFRARGVSGTYLTSLPPVNSLYINQELMPSKSKFQ